MKRCVVICLMLLLCRQAYAGGGGPGCAGLSCRGAQKTYWTDEQRAEVEARTFRGLWWNLGEREKEMFPNFYRAGNWAMRNVVAPAAQVAFNPWMQRHVWTPMSEMPPDFGPGPFDNFAAIPMIAAAKKARVITTTAKDIAEVFGEDSEIAKFFASVEHWAIEGNTLERSIGSESASRLGAAQAASKGDVERLLKSGYVKIVSGPAGSFNEGPGVFGYKYVAYHHDIPVGIIRFESWETIGHEVNIWKFASKPYEEFLGPEIMRNFVQRTGLNMFSYSEIDALKAGRILDLATQVVNSPLELAPDFLSLTPYGRVLTPKDINLIHLQRFRDDLWTGTFQYRIPMSD